MAAKNLVIRLFGMIIWYAAVFLFVYYIWFQNNINIYVLNGRFQIFVAVVFAAPVLIFKPHKIFVDRNWAGIIDNKGYRYGIVVYGIGSRKFRVEEFIILFIKRDSDGKIFKAEFLSGKAHIPNYYRIGDFVKHYKGVKYYEKVEKYADKNSFCIVCGSLNELTADKCENCQHILIK